MLLLLLLHSAAAPAPAPPLHYHHTYYSLVVIAPVVAHSTICNPFSVPPEYNYQLENCPTNTIRIGDIPQAELTVSEFPGDGTGLLAAANIVLSAFLVVFVAEWGDKSFFSTIALAAASSPLGVIGGALVGHVAATLLIFGYHGDLCLLQETQVHLVIWVMRVG